MTLHRDHRAPGNAPGSWFAWGAVGLVVMWAVWWILPRSSAGPASVQLQVLLPLVVQVAAAIAIGWGLWRGRIPSAPAQLALLALGAAMTMEAVVLLLVLFPPTA